MKESLVIAACLLTTLTASAYKDGTYECKNGEGFPPDVYKITTVDAAPGIRVPYVDITYFYEKEKGVIASSHARGFASVFVIDSTETLTLGNAHLEFSGDTMDRCKKP